MHEAQVNYVMSALRAMTRRRLGSLEVRAEVMRRYNRRIQAAMTGTVWTAGCHNYFRTGSGQGRHAAAVQRWSVLAAHPLPPAVAVPQPARDRSALTRHRVRSRAHVRAGRCGRVCRRRRVRGAHGRAAAATAREARRRARSARPRRRPDLDAAPRRRIAGRPRRRLARAEARRDLRPRATRSASTRTRRG